MKPSKIKLKINGMSFELPSKCLITNERNGTPLENPYIRIDQVEVASLVKQFVKQKYPSVVVSVKSDSYSMGDSVNVYLSTPDGYEVSSEIVKDVDSFGSKFEQGRFNGMEDMYEYYEDEKLTENGTYISGGTKYFFVNNRPKFGTVPDVARMLRDLRDGKYVGGNRDLESSIKWIKGYGVTQKTIDTALPLM
jgi:hypothetical protein